jgi:hypothetical protein
MVDFLTKIGRSLGISNAEGARIGAQLATGDFIGAAVSGVTSLGGENVRTQQPVDVSAPPAGIDSPATLSNVSQTSQVFSGGGFGSGSGFRSTMQQPNQAFIGGFGVPALIGQAGRLLSRPSVGGALTGIGAGLGFDIVTDMFGNQKKLVITRKLQREVKKVFMMSGGDIGFVSMNSMMLFGKDLNQDQILMILFKTFKNQGPFVTKAAVRKTAQTVRKMERLADLKERLCPPKRAPARRRMPGKSTTITNVR